MVRNVFMHHLHHMMHFAPVPNGYVPKAAKAAIRAGRPLAKAHAQALVRSKGLRMSMPRLSGVSAGIERG